MLMTVTNVSSTFSLNDFDVYQGYAGGPTVNAVGGARKYPLPFPFSHVVIAASGNKQLPVHPQDFRTGGSVPLWATLTPNQEWNQMIQAGLVTVAIAAETGRRDLEELFITAV